MCPAMCYQAPCDELRSSRLPARPAGSNDAQTAINQHALAKTVTPTHTTQPRMANTAGLREVSGTRHTLAPQQQSEAPPPPALLRSREGSLDHMVLVTPRRTTSPNHTHLELAPDARTSHMSIGGAGWTATSALHTTLERRPRHKGHECLRGTSPRATCTCSCPLHQPHRHNMQSP